MLNATTIGSRAATACALTPTDAALRLPSGLGAQFAPGAGNHYYLTIRDGSGNMERVKVTARTGDTLTITRGQDGTSARSWLSGACLSVEWNPAMLCEFVQNCAAGVAAPVGVTPGEYCLSACTCLTIGSDGRITNINTGTGC